jgi:hypothetical protein
MMLTQLRLPRLKKDVARHLPMQHMNRPAVIRKHP